MRKLFTISSFIFTTTLFAQDTLVTTNGDIVTVLVKSISDTEIEYKKANNPDGPTYVRSKSEVLAIHYKNGTTDTFSPSKKAAAGDDYYSPGASPTKSTSMNMSDVISATNITFYGCDFSNFSFVEPKRKLEADKIKSVHFSEWNTLLMKEIPAKSLSRWMKKFEITYDDEIVKSINSNVSTENLVTAYPAGKDMKTDIKRSVAAYAAVDKRTSGIGMVINVEYFYKAKNETSVYVTFFDIATHAVINSERVVVKEVSGAGLTNYWGAGLVAAVREYIDQRYKRF
jgi:hypothetical protein